jgi:hypothetical protein
MIAGFAPGRESTGEPVARSPGFANATPGGVEEVHRPEDWCVRLVREWLLLLLRFAITRDPKDEAAALIMARELDCLGRQPERSAPTFFRRSSRDLCGAVIPYVAFEA